MYKKKVVSMVLALAMLAGVFTACGAKEEQEKVDKSSDAVKEESTAAGESEKESSSEEAEGGIPEWLNPGEVGLVDEGEEKTLKIYINMSNLSTAEPEDYWQYDFIQEHMNVKLEVTALRGNRNEMVSLAFASGELPDIFLGCGFSAAELTKYGEIEGQILDMAPYLNEENMPNLSWILNQDKYKDYRNVITNGKGNVWSTGFARDTQEVGTPTGSYFINYDWLEECGLEVPESLDEFYEAMVAFKEKYPESYPVGGSAAFSPDKYFLNALGYIAGSGDYMLPAKRDGEFVIPVADREVFGEYIKFMNKLYSEELIHPDYYTMDKNTTQAVLKEGKNGFFPEIVFHYLTAEECFSWWSAKPLTSEYNEEALWAGRFGHQSTGHAVITTACEEPELAAAFIDSFYDFDMYELLFQGPVTNYHEEYLCDIKGRTDVYDANGVLTSQVYNDVESGDFPDSNTYLANTIRMIPAAQIGTNIWSGDSIVPYVDGWAGYSNVSFEEAWAKKEEFVTGNWAWDWLIYSQHIQLQQNMTYDIYPQYIYMSPEQTEKLGELQTALNTFVSNEIAKFVTGVRSLDELDTFFDELENYGIEEYVELYRSVLVAE